MNLFMATWDGYSLLDMSSWHGTTPPEQELSKHIGTQCTRKPVNVIGNGYDVVSMVGECALEQPGVINVDIPRDTNPDKVPGLVAKACQFGSSDIVSELQSEHYNYPPSSSYHSRVPTLVFNQNFSKWMNQSDNQRNLDTCLQVKSLANKITSSGLANVIIVHNNPHDYVYDSADHRIDVN